MRIHTTITFITLSLVGAAAGRGHAEEQEILRSGLACQAHWDARGQIGWDHRGAGNFGTTSEQVYCPVAETTSVEAGALGGSVRVSVLDNHPSHPVVCWAYSTQLDDSVTSWGPAEFSCQSRLSCGSNSYPGFFGISEMYIGVDAGLYHDLLGIGCTLPPPTNATNANTVSWVRGTRSFQ